MIKLYGKPIKVNKASSDRKAFDGKFNNYYREKFFFL
jgi:hypothetical protein